MLYEPKCKPKPLVRPGEMALIVILGIPGIWLFIRVFFGSMPLVERFGAFVCHHVFGI